MKLVVKDPWVLHNVIEDCLKMEWPTPTPLVTDTSLNAMDTLLILWIGSLAAIISDLWTDVFAYADTGDTRYLSLLMGHLSLFGVFLSAPIWYPGYRLAAWIARITRGVQQ